MASSFKSSSSGQSLGTRVAGASRSFGGDGSAGSMDLASPGGGPDGMAGADGGGSGQGAYDICIHVAEDGSLAVGVSHGGGVGADDAAGYGGDGGGQGGDAGMQPATDIKEALTMALEIYRSNGDGPADSGAMQDEFASGFSGGGGDGTGAGGAGGMGGAPLGARV